MTFFYPSRPFIRPYLDALDVVRVQIEARVVASVERRHEGAPDIRVREPKRVAELMGGYLEEVGACGWMRV